MLGKPFSKRNLSLISLGLLFALAVMSIALRPKSALADERVPIRGTFTVAAAATPNTMGVTYCLGTVALAMIVDAHGAGYSNLGALSFHLQKTEDVPGAMHGCLTLTAPNGDTLNATYEGSEGTQDPNRFTDGSGTLTFTGGKGRFRDASGNAQFTAVFSAIRPASPCVGTTCPPLQVMEFYSVEGTVFLPEEQELGALRQSRTPSKHF